MSRIVAVPPPVARGVWDLPQRRGKLLGEEPATPCAGDRWEDVFVRKEMVRWLEASLKCWVSEDHLGGQLVRQAWMLPWMTLLTLGPWGWGVLLLFSTPFLPPSVFYGLRKGRSQDWAFLAVSSEAVS